MANKFQIKRSAVPGNTPNTTSSSNSSFIDVGELAINVADEILYSSDGSSLITLAGGDTLDDVTTNGSTTTNSITLGGLTVDTNTLHVDATNNRVGIGTTSPAYQFEIENTGANALLVLDRTDGAACFIEGQASRSAFGSVDATPLVLAYDSAAVVEIGASGAITVNPDGASPYTFPTADGSADQYLKTDGSGNLSFAAGPLGYTGSAGSTGFTGSKGDVGFTGSKGDQGDAGANGSDGADGADGATGFTGSQGDTGFTGSAGSTGFTGSTGSSNVVPSNTAPTPSAGTIWFDTRTGKSYFYYNDGDSSQWILFADPTVTDGEQGYTGSKGDTGDTGFTGSQGIQGFTGSGGGGGASVTTSTSAPAGPSDGDLWWNEEEAQLKIYYDDGNSAQWVDATSGAQGNTGFTGSQGTLGYTGSQGAGFTGSAGATGFTGSQGDIGYTGSRGDTGFTGSQGDQGTSGFTGSASTVAGPTGFTGSRGSTGFTGLKGDTGFTGSASTVAGPTGFTGSQGDTGFTGSQGTTGFTGSKGDTYLTTSSTSLTIGTGSKSLTVGTGLAYSVSQTVKIANDASNYMEGTVTSYNSGTGALVVSVDTTSGSGTFSSWTVNLAGSTGAQGDTGFTGSRGDTGFTGSAGSDGGTGFTGSQGDTGFTGSQGDAGASGSDGATGFTGSSGATIPRGISLYDPTSSEDVTMFYTDSAITVSEVRAVCRGTSPSVTYTLKEAADRSATGTTIATATVTNTTTGATATISSSSIASGRYVWLETSATSGTVNEFHVNLSF